MLACLDTVSSTCDNVEVHMSHCCQVDSERPVLVDKYLDRADELDVDALCDKDGNVVISGIMQHIEQVCGYDKRL